MIDDISTAFKWNQKDALFAEQILAYEGTPAAIKYFSAHSSELSDYGYWFSYRPCGSVIPSILI